MYRRFLNIVFSILIASNGYSLGKRPNFQALKVKDELTHSNIQCIYQDSEGYIWIGTKDGLNRFDGSTIKRFDFDFQDSTSINHRNIREIYEDKNHRLWICTWGGGLAQFDRHTETFIKYTVNTETGLGIPHNFVSKIVQDFDGNYWLGTMTGAGLFNPAINEYTKIRMPEEKRYPVSDIVQSSSGEIWVGCINGHGLLKFDKQSNSFKQYKNRLASAQESNHINAIFELGTDKLLLGTGSGLFTFNIDHQTFEPLQFRGRNEMRVSFIMEKEPGKLWVGTQDKGLLELDTKQKHIAQLNYLTNEGEYLTEYSFTTWEIDRDGNIWLGTFEDGILVGYKYSNFLTSFKQDALVKTLKGNYINFITQDQNGNFWVAVREKGIYYFNREGSFLQLLKLADDRKDTPSANRVRFILEDHQGIIWIATERGGLETFNPKTKSFKLHHSTDTKHGIPSHQILSLAQDNEHNIWIGTVDKGIYKYNYGKKEFEHFPIPCRGPNIPYILTDDENIWISVIGEGLCRYNVVDNSFKLYGKTEADKISHNDVFYIHKAGDGKIWVTTAGGGFNCIDPLTDEIKWYGKQEGLSDNVVWGIVEDADGIFWIPTNDGLSYFDPRHETFGNFNTNDGICSNVFIEKSFYKDDKGLIYLGTNKGIVKFDPLEIDSNPIIPDIKITGFNYIFKEGKPEDRGKTFSPEDMVKIDHKVLGFSVNFVAFNYIVSSKNKYSYILEGFEKNWHVTNSPVSMTYSNILPGDYKFRVKAANNDGLWNMKGESIDIKIYPSPWKSKPAIIAYVLIVAALIYVTFRLVRAIYMSKKLIAEERRGKEREKGLNDMKIRFFTEISHELKTPLTLIFAPLQTILESNELNGKIKSQLSNISKNTSRLLLLINRLMDFRKLDKGQLKLEISRVPLDEFIENIIEPFEAFATSKNITFLYDINPKNNYVYFDPEKLATIIYNLLSNAFKYNKPGGSIDLSVHTIEIGAVKKLYSINFKDFRKPVSEFIEVKISDSGMGISEEDFPKLFTRFYFAKKQHKDGNFSSGIGLSYSYNLLKLHKGDIIVKSKLNEGSTFSFVIPVGKDAYNASEIVNKNSSISEFIPSSFDMELNKMADCALTGDNTQQPVVLIVEDNLEMVEVLQDILCQDYQITMASNGREGLKKLKESQPDLIISDIMMPVMDGLEFCKKIKTEFETCHIPLILLTAKSEIVSEIEGIESGADAYINKPFYPKHLLITIEKLLEGREKLRQVFSKGYLPNTNKCSLSSIDKKFIDDVKSIMEENYRDSEFSVDTLCKKLSLSRMTLYRKFSTLTNQSPSAFIRTFRLNKAAQLLAEESYSISEICYLVGFSTPTNFSVVFSKYYNLTPSEYREKYHEPKPPKIDLSK